MHLEMHYLCSLDGKLAPRVVARMARVAPSSTVRLPYAAVFNGHVNPRALFVALGFGGIASFKDFMPSSAITAECFHFPGVRRIAEACFTHTDRTFAHIG